MNKKQQVILGLGANLGNPIDSLKQAILHIRNIPGVEKLQISHFYRTSPLGKLDQPDFINAVCLFFTSLDWKELFDRLMLIEKLMGRKEKSKNQPREIDIDLLFFGNLEINTKEVIIPHPRWRERLFVLIPLHEFFEAITIGEKQWNIEALIQKLEKRDFEKQIYEQLETNFLIDF